MSLKPSFNDTVDMYFSSDSPMRRMVANNDQTEELVKLIKSAKDSGVALTLFTKKDGAVLARCSTDSFFHGKSYGFINSLYSIYQAEWSGYGMLRELFDPKNEGWIPLLTKTVAA